MKRSKLPSGVAGARATPLFTRVIHDDRCDCGVEQMRVALLKGKRNYRKTEPRRKVNRDGYILGQQSAVG